MSINQLQNRPDLLVRGQKAWSKNCVVLETIAPTLPYLTAAHMAHSTSWVVRPSNIKCVLFNLILISTRIIIKSGPLFFAFNFMSAFLPSQFAS